MGRSASTLARTPAAARRPPPIRAPPRRASATTFRTAAYDATTSKYQAKAAATPIFQYAERRSAMRGSYDSISNTFFLGWFDVGSEATPNDDGGVPANAALMINAYAPRAGAAKNAA